MTTTLNLTIWAVDMHAAQSFRLTPEEREAFQARADYLRETYELTGPQTFHIAVKNPRTNERVGRMTYKF